MGKLPSFMPENLGDAFAHINTVTRPAIDDLKLMVYLEASGQTMYAELAASARDAAVAKLLEANGREELAHAHRVAKAIRVLSGEIFEVPKDFDNPYAKPSGLKADRATLEFLAVGEDNGKVLYDSWADNTSNEEAAALFRQNGIEEARHGARAKEAIALMGS